MTTLSTFTIRDLFWLTTLCALGIGWWMAAQREAKLTEANIELQSLRLASG